MSVGIGNSIHSAECRIRSDNGPFLPRVLYRLCLKDCIAVTFGKLDNKNGRMVLKNLFPIVDVGMREIQRTARTAANVGARQDSCVIDPLEHEGLARTHSVDINKGERIVKPYGKRNTLVAQIFTYAPGTLCRR